MLSPYISVILASQIDDITQHVTKVSAMIESLIDLHVTYSDEFNVLRYVASKSKRPPISAPLSVSCNLLYKTFGSADGYIGHYKWPFSAK